MTFNTNYTYFLLGVITGVTNCNSSFTAVYLYIKAESAKAWEWFIKQYTRVHWPETQPLKVIIADFSKRL